MSVRSSARKSPSENRTPEPALRDGVRDELTPRERQVEAASRVWVADLGALVGNSPLWNIDTLGEAIVELTAAHPSGIAQLYAGRRTPLNNLVREGSALSRARKRTRVVLARTDELAQRFGVAPTYVAMGVASWQASVPENSTAANATGDGQGTAESAEVSGGALDATRAESDEGAPVRKSSAGDTNGTAGLGEPGAQSDESAAAKPTDAARAAAGPGVSDEVESVTAPPRIIHAPVLMRPVRIEAHGGEGGLELELDPAVEINSLLVRELHARGVEFDPAAITRSTMVEHGFSPRPALETLAELGKVLPGFTLEPRIVLGAFVHPGQALAEDLHAQARDLATHDVVAALAGVSGARVSLAATLPEPNALDRDPDTEGGIGDLDPAQHDVLDAVARGTNLLLDSPPGTDSCGTVAAVVAQAAADGKRVLYVPGTKRAGQALIDNLRKLGASDLLLDLSSDPQWLTSAAARLIDGLNPPAEDVDEDERAQDRQDLRDARQRLVSHLDALHAPREPWGVSAYDALQSLAQMTSARPGPRTRVRIPTDAVHGMNEDQRERARENLARAGALGAFRLRAADTPWFGARLSSSDHAITALEKVRQLQQILPDLIKQRDRTASQTGLDEAETLEQWSEQLVLLDGIRSSLDIFVPAIFERSAADMVAATATRAWRAEHHLDLRWSTRRRLRKQARDLVRPGVAVGDLHAELVDVQSRRNLWRRHCASGGWPLLPEGMNEILSTQESVAALVGELNPVLSDSLGGRTLDELPLDELSGRIARLSADDAAARQLPERAAVLASLEDIGLSDLLEDLTHRRVATDLVGAEFDLAWWSSVLEEILAQDPVLTGLDTSSLATTAKQLRSKDLRQVASLSSDVRARVREHIRAVIDHDRPLAQDFYRQARRPGADLKELLTKFPALSWAPRPIWVVPPMVVPQVFPGRRDIDLLVLDAVQHVPTEQVISAIVRSRQVVVVGDTRRGGGGVIGALSFLPTLTLPAGRSSQDPRLAAFLAQHGYEGVVRPVPEPPGPTRIHLEVVDGTGMPAPDSKVVESVQAEVDRVVDLVIDHALSRPDESLAVIALNTRHADRVREAVISVAQGSAAVADFFDADRPEAFTVVDVTAAAGLHRDAVILSLGFGKTPHGRVLHRFGAISGEDGAEYLVDALDAVRTRLTVVSCFKPGELDPERLRSTGAQMLQGLLQLAQDGAVKPLEEEEHPDVDRLLVDLAERLWRRGLTVVPRYGEPGGVRIPLAVGHPSLPGELLLAVLTDDVDYMAEPSLRRRDRYWIERLQARGWTVRMVYSSAVFMDPQGQAEELAGVVEDIVTTRLGGLPHSAMQVPSHLPEAAEEPEVSQAEAGLVSDESDPGHFHSVPRRSEREAALVGDEDESPIATVDAMERPDRPSIEPGKPLSHYSDDDLDALAAWICSDGQARTTDELREALRSELGVTKRGMHVDTVLATVARRSGLATDAYEQPTLPAWAGDESANDGSAGEEPTDEPADESPDKAAGDGSDNDEPESTDRSE